MAGIFIKELRLSGDEVSDAIVEFKDGVNIIHGPSNTGKTFIFECINYMLGSSKIPRKIKQIKKYSTVYLEVERYNGGVFTLVSDLIGGDLSKYESPINNINEYSEFDELKRKHESGNKKTLSYFILNECDLAKSAVRTNAGGKKRELSLRDIRLLHLIDELRIPTDSSPFLTGQHVSKTVEENVLKLLLTNNDDSKVIESMAPKVLENKKGKLEVFSEILDIEIKKLNNSEITLNEVIEQENKLLISIKENAIQRGLFLDKIKIEEGKKADILNEINIQSLRRDELSVLVNNSDILSKQYISDVNRLKSTMEVGTLLLTVGSVSCPTCHATIDDMPNDDVNRISISAHSELLKFNGLVKELKEVRSNFFKELDEVESQLKKLNLDFNKIQTNIDEVFKAEFNNIIKKNDELRDKLLAVLIDKRTLESIDYLNDQKNKIEVVVKEGKDKKKIFEVIPVDIMNEIAKEMYSILFECGYPDLDNIKYDDKNKDFLLSGEGRNLAGKGYRAISFASFSLSLLKYCSNKDKRFGFILLDSPLVTYKKPDVPEGEAISENMAQEFYNVISSLNSYGQIIIIENEPVPNDIKSRINNIHFTKNKNIGRYGFVPM